MANYYFNNYFADINITDNESKVKVISDKSDNNWQINYTGKSDFCIIMLDNGELIIKNNDEIYVSEKNNSLDIEKFKNELKEYEKN